jgi:hypothetical protein
MQLNPLELLMFYLMDGRFQGVDRKVVEEAILQKGEREEHPDTSSAGGLCAGIEDGA